MTLLLGISDRDSDTGLRIPPPPIQEPEPDDPEADDETHELVRPVKR